MKTIPGSKLRKTHQASVDAILGPNAPQVVSKGDQFMNCDRWTAPMFAKMLVKCPDSPSFESVVKMVGRVNSTPPVAKPRIQIAATPDNVSSATAKALIGGAYHEAWHTKYSMRDNLDPHVMWSILESRWTIGFWDNKGEALVEWMNIVEDVRIERLGNAEFPGALSRMEALQDFILDIEADNPAEGAEVEIAKIFRDRGLGYTTSRQVEAMSERDPKYVTYVENSLGDLLTEAIHSTAEGKLDNLRIAMDILIRLDRDGISVDKPPGGGRPETLALAFKSQDNTPVNGTMPWRAYTCEGDQIAIAPSNPAASTRAFHETRSDANYMMSRLRTRVRATQQGSVLRGVNRGSQLSSQMLTDSYAALRGGTMPRRAFDSVGTKNAPSVAMSLMVDESGSMSGSLSTCVKILALLGKVMDSLGVASEMVGFRGLSDSAAEAGFHRTYPVFFDVLKTYTDKTMTVSSRIGGLRAEGLTPTGDAIHYGLHSLRERPERTKALFVITDGDPNPPNQTKVVRHYVDTVSDIPIYGIGVGAQAINVKSLFGERGIWVPKFQKLSTEILRELQRILLEEI